MRAKEARHISIIDYLSSQALYPLKKRDHENEYWYSSPLRKGDSTPSFKVDRRKNLWFDFGLSQGWNALDLVLLHQNINVKQALSFLEGSTLTPCHTHFWETKNHQKTQNHSQMSFLKKDPVQASYSQVTDTRSNENQKKMAGEKEKNNPFEIINLWILIHPALFQFLKKRSIDKEIAQHYLQEVHYRPKETKKSYFALAWSCGDGYEVRNPYFKGFLWMNKSFIKINFKTKQEKDNQQTLSIFEGFMDFLSFLTYYDKKSFSSSVIILNSINLRKKALKEIEKHTFSKIYLFLDNDPSGKETTHFFQTKITSTPLVDKSYLYEKYNDFNEMIIKDSQ